MTVWTFKASSDLRNKLLLDIALDGSNALDDIAENLSSMELHSGTGSPDTSVTKPLNTLWQNMLKEKMQELDGINRSGQSFTVIVPGKLMGSETKRDILSIVRDGTYQLIVRTNDMSANRTDISARPRLSLGRAVASHNRKTSNHRVICSYYSHIYKS